MMNRERRCKYPGCKPLLAIPRTTFLLSENKSYIVCRRHKTEINKLNAQHIGKCEVVESGIACKKKPVTMAIPPYGSATGKQIAVCRTHNAIISEVYASLRKEN